MRKRNFRNKVISFVMAICLVTGIVCPMTEVYAGETEVGFDLDGVTLEVPEVIEISEPEIQLDEGAEYPESMAFSSREAQTATAALDDDEEDTSAVAKIGDTTYSSVANALTAAGETEEAVTITMMADSTEDIVIYSGQNIVLDLNGYTLTGTGAGSVVMLYGTMTLQDSSVDDSGTITGGTGTRTSETAQRFGGGIYVNGGTLIMRGGSISGNSTNSSDGSGGNWGGGVYVGNSGKFYLYSGKITENSSVNQYGRGGGVCVNTNCVFEMYGGEISYNSAVWGGGVAYIGNADFTMEGGAISYNKASAGAGVWLFGKCTFTMNDGEITYNTSTDGYGGGIGAGSNAFTLNGGTIGYNSCTTYGGGVYIYEGGYLKINGGSIIENSAGTYGGGVYSYCSVEMNDGSISSNTSAAIGGICIGYVSGDEIMFSMSGGEICNNTANTYCAAVYINNATFSMSGGTISGNESNSGGAVYGYGATINMSGGSINDNSAVFGGGVVIFDSAEFNMSGGEISENSTTQGAGGVYINTSSVFTMEGGEIESNTTEGTGGGIVISNSSIFNLKDGTISNNISEGTSGGISVRSTSTLNVSGGTITGNESAKDGGGVYVLGTLNLSDTATITGNTGSDTDNNVYLPAGKYINLLSDLDSSSVVGVTVESADSYDTYDREITSSELSAGTSYYALSYTYFIPDVKTVSGMTVISKTEEKETDSNYVEFSLVPMVTLDLTNVSESEGTLTVTILESGDDYTTVVAADTGYSLPETITISTDDGAVINDYSYDSAAGIIEINNVTLNYTITVVGVLDDPSVSITDSITKTYDGEDITLTATGTHVLDSVDGSNLTYSYQWEKDGKAIDGATSSTYTLTGDEVNVTGSTTYTCVVTVTDSYGNSASAEASTVVIITQAQQSISYAETEVSKKVGDEAFTNELTETLVYGDITYTSSNSSVATVAENGKVTIVGAGTATITATVSGSDNYSGASASYTITVALASTTSETETGTTETSEESNTSDTDSDDTDAAEPSDTTVPTTAVETASAETGDDAPIFMLMLLMLACGACWINLAALKNKHKCQL